MERGVLLLQCPDKPGLIAKISEFVFSRDCNILKMDQHTTEELGGRFFMRLEFCWSHNGLTEEALRIDLEALAQSLEASWELCLASRIPRMALAVSKFDHCLLDLLYRVRNGELRAEIPLVISNHDDLREEVERYGIPFHHLPVDPKNKSAQEAKFLELIQETSDFLVLARYMQILSNDFLNSYGKDIINIHHSFLPSFKGANPYRQAYERGVKIIGATAHFASADLDEGPIIEQSVVRVSHSDTAADLKRLGRTREQIALSRAIHAYVEHRIIRYENRTIVFQ